MLRFFRRQKPVQEAEIQELRDNFELEPPISHGIPRNVHHLAVDSLLGLIAVITKQGYLELYNRNGQKKVLLKKLGSPCTFFKFIEGDHLLLIICSANPSSGLPESYHLIDTNGNDSCSTTCRPTSFPQAKCFTLAKLGNGRESLLTGNSNGSVQMAVLNKDQLEFTEFVSMKKLFPTIPDDKFEELFNEFTHIKTSNNYLFCCFRSSFVVILCLTTRRLLKTIDLPSKFTALSFNESLKIALFVSTEMHFCISLNDDLKVNTSKMITKSFERTNFYKVLISARTNEPIVIYTSGIPECSIRQVSSFTLNTMGQTFIFAVSSELLDIRVVYENDEDVKERKATTILLLCEHEILAIDLLDEQFRCISLNFLQCVDSSSVTSIRLQSVENPEFYRQSNDRQYSKRTIFGDDKSGVEKGPKTLIFTGHQNGDIFVWDLTNGGQQLLQVFKATNYLKTGLDDCIAEDELPDDLEISEDDSFKIEEFGIDSSSMEWILSPAKLWQKSKSKKVIEIGIYDDRCEDDRLAIESFYYCDQQRLLACGLYGGFVIVSSITNEKDSKSHIQVDDLKFLNAKLAENDQSATTNDPIKLQKSSQWENSIFKPRPHILCITPHTPIRTISISDTSGLIAVGCSTGIVIFEPTNGRVIFSKNFLNYNGTQTVLAGEKPLNRLKTMKQTVRKTFRGHSLRMSRAGNQRVAERQVEFRDTKQPSNNGIRCVRFHENNDERSFLFAGTANAIIYMFELEGNDICYLFKEIRLSHCAPVVDINFIRLDNQSRMFVFTEEQIRCFVVENLRSSRFSYKLTAKCGVRIKQANVVSLPNGSNYLNMLCNDGNLLGISANDQRIRTTKQITKSDDAIGIRLSAVSNCGKVAYIGHCGSTLTFFATKNHY